MRNSSNSSLISMLVKGALILIGIIIVISLFQKIIAVVASLLFLAFIVVAVLAALRYFGRSRNRY